MKNSRMERLRTLRNVAALAVAVGALGVEAYAVSTVDFKRVGHLGFEPEPQLIEGDLSCLHKESGGMAFTGDQLAFTSRFTQDCSTFSSGAAGNANSARASISAEI